MTSTILIAACALCLGGTVQAASPVRAPMLAGQASVRYYAVLPDLAVTRRNEIVTPPSHLPQLPEPEVFVMMLVGLLLIGYRVSRDGGDKFR